jgi:hypothetical protein
MLILRITAAALLSAPFLTQDPAAPKSTVALSDGVTFADPLTLRAPHDFLRGLPAKVSEHVANAVVASGFSMPPAR